MCYYYYYYYCTYIVLFHACVKHQIFRLEVLGLPRTPLATPM